MKVIEMIPEVNKNEKFRKGYKSEVRLKREQEVKDFIRCGMRYCIVDRQAKTIAADITGYRQSVKDVCDEYEKIGKFYTITIHQRGDRICLERVF